MTGNSLASPRASPISSSDLSSSEDFASCSSISSYPNDEESLDNKTSKSRSRKSKSCKGHRQKVYKNSPLGYPKKNKKSKSQHMMPPSVVASNDKLNSNYNTGLSEFVSNSESSSKFKSLRPEFHELNSAMRDNEELPNTNNFKSQSPLSVGASNAKLEVNSKLESAESMYVSDSYSESESQECIHASGSLSKTEASKCAVLGSDFTIPDNEESNKIEEDPIKKEILLRFQPLCITKDEIAMLEGMVEFSEVIKLTPTGVKGFHSFIKDSLTCKLTHFQLSSKLSKLKQTCMSLAHVPMEDLSPYEQQLLNLGKKLWDCVKNKTRKRPESLVKCPLLLDTVIELRHDMALEYLEKLDPIEAAALEGTITKEKALEKRYHIGGAEIHKTIYDWIMTRD